MQKRTTLGKAQQFEVKSQSYRVTFFFSANEITKQKDKRGGRKMTKNEKQTAVT